MTHVAAPHFVDGMGLLVGGLALVIAFFLRFILDENCQAIYPIVYFLVGAALILLSSEVFVVSNDVVIFYRTVAIIGVFVVEIVALHYILWQESLLEQIAYWRDGGGD